ncbi:MAG TPA: peptidoglycan-binding protein [Chthoniobacteraceae bacterium]|jgi:peptidoglycan hydrolase-like protein with peptidoglycan-binding domain
MKSTLSLFTILLFCGAAAFADDQTRNVQSQLKNQGFYYGDVDGKTSGELSAAIKRYQIRNGLQVTGELNKETLGSLGLAGESAEAPAKQQSPPAVERPHPNTDGSVPKPKSAAPPVNLRRNDDYGGGDSQVAPDEAVRPHPHGPGYLPPPAPLDDRNPVAPGPNSGPPAGPYSHVFAGTPYAAAPRVVQESTLRRAQQILADRGFYRDAVTGQPSPAMEEALLTYQRSARLPLTGKLDLPTLSVLHLLPGRGPGNPPLKPFNPQAENSDPGSRPVYRGVWVQ